MKLQGYLYLSSYGAPGWERRFADLEVEQPEKNGRIQRFRLNAFKAFNEFGKAGAGEKQKFKVTVDIKEIK